MRQAIMGVLLAVWTVTAWAQPPLRSLGERIAQGTGGRLGRVAAASQTARFLLAFAFGVLALTSLLQHKGIVQ